jgi:DNA-binding NarL/FixJ family response regulator
MNIAIVTPVRLMGDGLVACFKRHSEILVGAVVSNLTALAAVLESQSLDLVLIDVTHGIELSEVRLIAAQRPNVALVALGLTEQRQDVIRCGQAGFVGYVPRDASFETLGDALFDVVRGRQACPAEISGGLLRALFRGECGQASQASLEEPLTRRELDVMTMMSRGYSNKEIARDLELSVATVKHHVHKILAKLHVSRRAQVMRQVRDEPWLMPPLDAATVSRRAAA